MFYVTHNSIIAQIMYTAFKNYDTVFIISHSETVAVQHWCWANYEVTLPTWEDGESTSCGFKDIK